MVFDRFEGSLASVFSFSDIIRYRKSLEGKNRPECRVHRVPNGFVLPVVFLGRFF